MVNAVVSDSFTHLLQPDTLLPVQFFASLRQKSVHEPERRLLMAVLQDAIDCFQKHLRSRDRKARQLYLEAEEWILSDDRSWAFSFANVCEVLDIHADYLRRGLLAWRERELGGHGRLKVVVLSAPVAADDDALREASAG